MQLNDSLSAGGRRPERSGPRSHTERHRPREISADPQGSRIGTVSKVIQGGATYVLVASDSGVTPIPYAAVSHLQRDAHIVIDRSILESAPRFSEAQFGADSDDTWQRAADQYRHVYRYSRS